MFKKIIALSLVLIVCISAVGCSSSKTPDGMYLASLEGEPFRLYVHDAWTPNTASGISGAYLPGASQIAVSARYYPQKDPKQTLDNYAWECIFSYAEDYTDFQVIQSPSAALLGGANATGFKYTAKHQDISFTFSQYIAKHNGDFIVLAFRCPTDLYANYESQFSEVREKFVLCEKSKIAFEVVTDKDTPTGMQIASSESVEYRFYAPQTWICDANSGASEAYYPESGKPNVTVTSYVPSTDTMTAEQYFAQCEEQYKNNIEGYTRVSEETRTVASRSARSYVYTAQYGNTKLKIMQTVFSYNQMIYSITYTALADSFDTHMDDVNAMLNAFRLR